jgi:two-component system, NarL family, nitrate/nitrite response regulator NarL
LPPISIVIADDHPIFRDGLRRLLEAEADLRVAGTAGDGEEAVRLVRKHKPDVLLLDLAMPRRSGLDVLRDLSADPTGVHVIVLAAAVDETQMIEALELGARGIVLKDTTTTLLIKCIHVVVEGQYWVGRESVSGLVDGLRQARQQRHERAASRYGLTDRQMEIVTAIVAGSSNRVIAESLGISEDTVKQHLTSIFDKCGVSSRVELAMFAVHHRLVEQ